MSFISFCYEFNTYLFLKRHQTSVMISSSPSMEATIIVASIPERRINLIINSMFDYPQLLV